MPEMGRVLVVLPTYNERENLARMLPAILEQPVQADVLVVDDESPDGTGQLADALSAREPRVSVLHRRGQRGLGGAYVAGFNWALERGYRYIFEMDADFSHRPSDLPRLLAGARNAEVVIGSRWIAGGAVRNWSLGRQYLSRGGSLYARAILGLPLHDLTSGFKCFRAEVLAALDLEAVCSNGYAFQIELNYLCFQLGCRIEEVPIVFVDRDAGCSKMTASIAFEAMSVVCKLRLRHWANKQRAVRPAMAARSSAVRLHH